MTYLCRQKAYSRERVSHEIALLLQVQIAHLFEPIPIKPMLVERMCLVLAQVCLSIHCHNNYSFIRFRVSSIVFLAAKECTIHNGNKSELLRQPFLQCNEY